jgi:hypothetical protein
MAVVGPSSIGASLPTTVWVGCDDGRVLVYDPFSEALLTSFKTGLAGGISSLAAVGSQVRRCRV